MTVGNRGVDKPLVGAGARHFIDAGASQKIKSITTGTSTRSKHFT
jgi:hypothetical protein